MHYVYAFIQNHHADEREQYFNYFPQQRKLHNFLYLHLDITKAHLRSPPLLAKPDLNKNKVSTF